MLGPLWKWDRCHTLAKPCLAALGLVLISGQMSGSEGDASHVREREVDTVSTSGGSIYHTQARFDPPFAEGAEFTE